MNNIDFEFQTTLEGGIIEVSITVEFDESPDDGVTTMFSVVTVFFDATDVTSILSGAVLADIALDAEYRYYQSLED